MQGAAFFLQFYAAGADNLKMSAWSWTNKDHPDSTVGSKFVLLCTNSARRIRIREFIIFLFFVYTLLTIVLLVSYITPDSVPMAGVWKITGALAAGILALVTALSWWHQRRLRKKFIVEAENLEKMTDASQRHAFNSVSKMGNKREISDDRPRDS